MRGCRSAGTTCAATGRTRAAVPAVATMSTDLSNALTPTKQPSARTAKPPRPRVPAGAAVHGVLVIGPLLSVRIRAGRPGSNGGSARVQRDSRAPVVRGSIELIGDSSGRGLERLETARRRRSRSAGDRREHVVAVQLELARTDARQPRQLAERGRPGLGDSLQGGI